MCHMIISFEAKIDCAAGHAGYVATNVVTEQVMPEEQISRLPKDLDRLRQGDIRVPTRGHQPVGALLPEEGRVGQVRPKPHPKIAHIRAWLILSCHDCSLDALSGLDGRFQAGTEGRAGLQ